MMKKAEQFIVENGGLRNASMMTKFMLAVNGLYPWPNHIVFPMTILLVPKYLPFDFFELSTYARIHFVPMMIAANKKLSLTSKWTPDLQHLFVRTSSPYHSDWSMPFSANQANRSLLTSIFQEFKKLATYPEYLHRLAYQRAETFMLDRIERDGTLYSYASATFFMIYALLALNYEKNSPVIIDAIKGIKSLICKTNGYYHLENSTSTVWDTALVSYTLQQAGVSSSDPMIKASTRYLLKRQHTKKRRLDRSQSFGSTWWLGLFR